MNTVIKQLNGNVYDVFYGDKGWDDWARFEVRENRLHVVTCEKQLPPNIMAEVRAKLTKPRFLGRSR